MKLRTLFLAVALAGCVKPPAESAAVPAPHYVVGTPYRAGGIWRYPRAQFDYDDTGLAGVTTRLNGLTVDGEVADATAMAAAHPTLQLPAIVQVTNLDTGYQVLVRVNDRGPADPGRIIALTPRAMTLLGAAGQAALRVRVAILPAESEALALDLGGNAAPVLALAAVPAGVVAQQSLAPPAGAAASAPRAIAALPQIAPSGAAADGPKLPPLRLPETVTRVFPSPGSLYVEAAALGHLDDAEMLRRHLAGLGAEVSTSYDAPRDRAYRVRIGPLAGAAAADAMLARTLAAGIPGARIVAE